MYFLLIYWIFVHLDGVGERELILKLFFLILRRQILCPRIQYWWILEAADLRALWPVLRDHFRTFPIHDNERAFIIHAVLQASRKICDWKVLRTTWSLSATLRCLTDQSRTWTIWLLGAAFVKWWWNRTALAVLFWRGTFSALLFSRIRTIWLISKANSPIDTTLGRSVLVFSTYSAIEVRLLGASRPWRDSLRARLLYFDVLSIYHSLLLVQIAQLNRLHKACYFVLAQITPL